MTSARDEMLRRLELVRKHAGSASDDTTKERLTALVADLQAQIAVLENKE